MISHFLYHPVQVSWSDGLVPLACFPPGPGEQSDVFSLFYYDF